MRRNKRTRSAQAVFSLVCVNVFVLFLTLWGTAADAQVRTCRLEINSQYDSDSQVMQKFLRCLNSRISDLQNANKRLQRRIAALEGLVGELPAPWSNVNGVITQEPDRPIGSATFLLSSRSTGGANALAIDQDVMEGLCDQSGGCTLVVTYKQLSVFNKTPTDSEISGPCQFTYNKTSGDWVVGAGCGADQAISGSDGDGGLARDESRSFEIATAGGACVLADSGLEKAVGDHGGLAPDRGKGLFLIAMPSRQSGVNRRFQCEMSLE